VVKQWKKKKLKWLNHNEFFIKTGFKKENTYFCYRRGEKVHVIKQLGITHFVDDHVDVLTTLSGTVDKAYLFRTLETKIQGNNAKDFECLTTWKDLYAAIIKNYNHNEHKFYSNTTS